ncbi:MAG: helix-turn-helix transcriptional regulator [Bacteroides sp.]|nr:helix-turn-helix transcriptional regulator [Bacteroides sp.]
MTEEHTTTKNPLEGIDMGLNLRVARLRQKLTQTALLELTGIRQTDISAMENQEVIEDEESLVKLVKELGTTLEAIKETKAEDLLGGKAPNIIKWK